MPKNAWRPIALGPAKRAWNLDISEFLVWVTKIPFVKEFDTLSPIWGMQFMVLLHFQVGLSLYVTLKHALRELEGAQKIIARFRSWTPWTWPYKACWRIPPPLQGQIHMVGWENLAHLDTPTTIGLTIDHRMHRKSSDVKLQSKGWDTKLVRNQMIT